MLSFFTPLALFKRSTWISLSKWPMLQTIAWSFIFEHVLQRDDVAVAGGGDVDVAAAERVFDGGDFETFHRRLQRVDGIDLRDDDARAETAQANARSLCRRRRNRRRPRLCRRS